MCPPELCGACAFHRETLVCPSALAVGSRLARRCHRLCEEAKAELGAEPPSGGLSGERPRCQTDQKKEVLPIQEESDLEKKRREAEALLQSMGLTPDSPIASDPTPFLDRLVIRLTADALLSTPPTLLTPVEYWSRWESARQLIYRIFTRHDKSTPAGSIAPEWILVVSLDYDEDEDDVVVPKPSIEPEEEKTLKNDEEEEAAPHELTEEEKQQILHSEEFLSFFDHSTRIVERALSEQINIFFDYSGRDLEDKEGEIQAGAKLSLNRQFFDERWSKHRVVSCLDWSSQYPELLVASYNNNEDAPHEPDGVALVWNMKYKKTTPEYVFHCQSAVMSATFAKFHPNLVVGGTYSGQIVLWDNRSNKRTPVQRTPLSAAAHTDSMELIHKQSKAVAVTCMSFPVGDVNNFVVGSEEGSVYTACRHGSKAGISEMFEGHQGPITGIHCHAAVGPVDFSHLFVTSSFDWTVKLWTTKNNKPLYSFEDNSDYVYDVMWSPTHPALFACVDGMGRLDLWNLNSDTEVPTASITVEGNPALNRVRWTHSGREIAVGDSEGQIVIYDVGEQIAVPRNDEWTRFGRTLAEINANRADAEEEAATRIPA
ncbi:Cytoplasmic dynein 1 intermediate chain 2 [Chelonia mydas]|uniref:Cytoplasmic dynein 1 intermediate chain 2 n=1 Tax=Chelonia mydas TaxID=8469 RepID=M7C2P1_CHEMY|nr:Cytoplasmic dynein 1 intermediate chain 2 [Chelonia mydas]